MKKKKKPPKKRNLYARAARGRKAGPHKDKRRRLLLELLAMEEKSGQWEGW